GYIKGIIGMPANLFYGTGIPASIIIVDKKDAHARKGIFIIDASKGFIKDGNKNRLRDRDIHQIVDVFNHQLEKDGFARMVPFSEIEENEYNLNIPRYIDNQEEEDTQDIAAHLKGGIPDKDIDALSNYWDEFPSIKNALFQPLDREGYSELKVKTDAIKDTIFTHGEFSNYKDTVYQSFDNWKDNHLDTLQSINPETVLKAIIHQLSEDILEKFIDVPLVEAYEMYQHVMRYWYDTMKDDVFVIVEDGWQANEILIP